ncbi:MAG: glycosyltransferase [Sulfolobales archaeon]
MHKILICVLTYNREWIIGDVLRNILSQDYPKDLLRIVIVDNYSSDRTIEIAKKILEREKVKYEII